MIPGKNLWNGEQRSSIGPFANRFDFAILVLILVFGALTNAAGMIAPVSALLERAQFLVRPPSTHRRRFVPFGRNSTDPGVARLHGRVSQPEPRRHRGVPEVIDLRLRHNARTARFRHVVSPLCVSSLYRFAYADSGHSTGRPGFAPVAIRNT